MKKDWTGDYHSVCVTLGARNECKEERAENDYYATHPEAALHLMEIEKLSHNIWECACGEGHLARTWISAGYNVKCTDLVYRGFGVGGVDFLKCTEMFDGDIITNPPYKQALEFVEHAYELVPEGRKVCMFLKIQFLEGKRRREFFNKHPPKRVWVSTSRIPCGRNGVFEPSAVCYAWFVWEKGWTGAPMLGWFN